MKKLALLLIIFSLLTGCSTSGGIYSKDDATHGEFSAGRTLLSIIAVAGAVALAKEKGGGYAAPGYAWDYQPGNGQWVCRDGANGQYANNDNCAGLPMVDNWP
jgi:hypothetical protein